MDGSDHPLAHRFDVALLDLDGVVYLGEQPIPGVPDTLEAVRQAGMRLAFVTNNASRTPQQVADLLNRLNIQATAADVITSSHAAAHYLADQLPDGARVLVLGTTGLVDAVAERGLTPVFSADEHPAAVVQGFSPDLDWHALAEGMVAIRAGVPWIATNLDPTVPSPRGPLPGNGSLVAALRHATGITPKATGKPDPTMHAESVQRSHARHPLVVGDRLDTDVEGARRADCASLLVLTGVTSPHDLLIATADHRPDFLGYDVAALLSSHPEIRVTGSTVQCRAARADISGHLVTVRLADQRETTPAQQTTPRDGTRRRISEAALDVLRAAATASWQILDAGSQPRLNAADHAAAALLAELGLAEASPGTVTG